MSRLRATAAAAALLLALPLSVAAAAPALAAPAAAFAPTAAGDPSTVHVELPRPTGPYAVGQEVLHLVDGNRPDPWVPSAGPRQLMVTMYYPAHAGTGSPAPYMTAGAARMLLDTKLPGNSIPTEAVTGTRTWARSDAHPQGGHYPLVVLSPGFTMPRTSLTGLAEDLTSRGYVVALVDHTYENTGTTFPDGRTLPCVPCGKLDEEGFRLLDEGRAKDVSFVIDQLTDRPHPAWRYARMIDPSRIGMAGHSAGGASTVPAMAADDRIRAGVDLDGTMSSPVPASGLGGRPYLMINHHLPDSRGDDPSWTDAWSKLDGWKRWLSFDGANHGSFTDFPLFFEQLGLPQDDGTTMSGQRAVSLTRQYVGAFFDLQLKGVDQPLLDGPAPANPEVGFHS